MVEKDGKKKKQPNHKAIDCKIILAVVHGWSVPSLMSLSSFSLLLCPPFSSAPCNVTSSTTATGETERGREGGGCMGGKKDGNSTKKIKEIKACSV